MSETDEKPEKPVCSHCGSDNVLRNCDAEWNVDAKEWEIVALYDSWSCEPCGTSDASVEWVEA